MSDSNLVFGCQILSLMVKHFDEINNVRNLIQKEVSLNYWDKKRTTFKGIEYYYKNQKTQEIYARVTLIYFSALS